MQHSKFSPSSAYRWIECHGSAGADGEGGEEAEVGTAAHAIASGEAVDLTRFDAEQREIIEQCAAKWFEVMEEAYHEPGDFHVEQRYVSEVIPDFGGTLDTLRVSDDTLHVYDLKTGMGAVSAENNPQLGCYLLLAKEKFPGRERFFGTIVQPRLNYVGTFEYTAAALARLREKIVESVNNSDLRAGQHCEYCPLLATCRVAFDEAEALMRDAPQAAPEPNPELPEDIARWARLVEFAKAFGELESTGRMHMLSYIQSGGQIKGWKAATQGAKRVWRNEKAALAALAEVVDDPSKLVSTKMISPAQAEKLKIEIPEALIYKPPSKTVLAKRSSPRTEVIAEDGSEFE